VCWRLRGLDSCLFKDWRVDWRLGGLQVSLPASKGVTEGLGCFQLVVVSNNTYIERCDGWLIDHMLVGHSGCPYLHREV
jgi:hypothetical protein